MNFKTWQNKKKSIDYNKRKAETTQILWGIVLGERILSWFSVSRSEASSLAGLKYQLFIDTDFLVQVKK